MYQLACVCFRERVLVVLLLAVCVPAGGLDTCTLPAFLTDTTWQTRIEQAGDVVGSFVSFSEHGMTETSYGPQRESQVSTGQWTMEYSKIHCYSKSFIKNSDSTFF